MSADEVAKFKVGAGLYFGGMSESAVEEAAQKLAASDPSTLAGLKQAIGESPFPRQSSIVKGLAKAAQACVISNRDQARAIQVVAVDLPTPLRIAFEQSAGQATVASIGGAGAASAGAAGGPTAQSGTSTSNGGYSGPVTWSTANGPTTNAVTPSTGATRTRTVTIDATGTAAAPEASATAPASSAAATGTLPAASANAPAAALFTTASP